jgi:hypothetical protein
MGDVSATQADFCLSPRGVCKNYSFSPFFCVIFSGYFFGVLFLFARRRKKRRSLFLCLPALCFFSFASFFCRRSSRLFLVVAFLPTSLNVPSASGCGVERPTVCFSRLPPFPPRPFPLWRPFWAPFLWRVSPLVFPRARRGVLGARNGGLGLNHLRVGRHFEFARPRGVAVFFCSRLVFC